MSTPTKATPSPVDALGEAFLLHYPGEAARKLSVMMPEDAAKLLCKYPLPVLKPVFRNFAPGILDNILIGCPDEMATQLLYSMEPGSCAALLNRLPKNQRLHYLQGFNPKFASEIREFLTFPADSVGSVMDTSIIAFNEGLTVEETLTQLRNQKSRDLHHLFLINDQMYLQGQVPIQRLALADSNATLSALATPIQAFVRTLDPKSDIMEKLEKNKMDTLPVLDGNDYFVGVIREKNFLGVLKETLGTEMQTMVGVSKDERALSSSWFAVKKRLPWLQINLLTAFLAAAVVGLFEATIAKYTALAILLPIAAGQSGNTGAQALAVTMRGITLREITVRHWLRVAIKEAGAALINGLAIALTCGIGVYVWSQSLGLALIIALAMISSMFIAAVSGALVPILLKRFGQDPALSSSIILTTVTDIAGFMSFLGIATLLSGMLEAS